MMPPELIHRIGLFSSDSPSLFAFLEAFSPCKGVVGNLEALLRLGQRHAPQDLWPRLRFHCPPDAQDLLDIKLVLDYYNNIDIDGIFDLTWLIPALQDHPQVVVHVLRQRRTGTKHAPLSWFESLESLNIQSISVSHVSLLSLLPKLPSMSSLVSIQVLYYDRCNDAFFEALFNSLPTSNITSFSLSCNRYVYSEEDPELDLSRSMLLNLICWIELNAITRLDLEYYVPEDDTIELLPAFYQALASSKTLRHVSLGCQNLDLFQNQVFATPFSFETLALTSENFNTENMKALCTGLYNSTLTSLTLECSDIAMLCAWLPQSNLRFFSLVGASIDSTTKMQILCEALTQTPTLRHLRLGGCSGQNLFPTLALYLPNTTIERLEMSYSIYSQAINVTGLLSSPRLQYVNLSGNHFTDVHAFQLAHDLKDNNNICHLVLDENELAETGLNALIQSIEERKLPMNVLSVNSNPKLNHVVVSNLIDTGANPYLRFLGLKQIYWADIYSSSAYMFYPSYMK
ncbi:Aste57867_9166 [Aphanomyces stellatus]|uniref:Aste57867_9166 protein n=1 Tax=Aphanomyces stellatus TaxID=120398 RepID=A0A485KMD3_9STRA|nr:hypothetical protein As57867_009130 [Aphanomyces stellatus]VFT86050.1 Aste57867_9166 [Aphanomyces stellatus]